MKISVSVAVCVRNAEKYISKCIRSILDQTFSDFEIVIIDDISIDNTRNIIERFDDKRIRYFRNEKLLGLSSSRNLSVKFAKGEYIFFTDSDCTVSKNWIEEGLKYLKDLNCIGVEGRIYYVSEDYEPTFSDYVIENRYGGHFMTANMAYSKEIIETVGGFDYRLTYLEDRDIALRIMKNGKICFNPEMIVYHQKKVFHPKQFVQTGKRIGNRVLLYKKFRDKPLFFWRIVYPLALARIIFPPLIFGSLFSKRYRTKEDYDLFPFIYVRLIYERLNFWDMCARERVFLI